jgi:hypothetical protein
MTDGQDPYKEALSLNDLLILINDEVAGIGESKIPTAIIKNCCDSINKEFGTYPVLGVTVNYLLMLKGELTIDKIFINNFEKKLLSVVYNWLQEGGLVAFGFSNINNPDVAVIPDHEWAFLTIDKESNSAFYEDKQYGNIKFVLSENNSAHNLEILTTEEKINSENKTRKKLKPLLRETNSALMLLYDIFDHYQIKYLDQLPANKAWGRIIKGEFESEYINSISDAKKSIILIDNENLSKDGFLEKYRKRFIK